MPVGQGLARAALVCTVMVLTGTTFSIRSSSGTTEGTSDVAPRALPMRAGDRHHEPAEATTITVANLAPSDIRSAARSAAGPVIDSFVGSVRNHGQSGPKADAAKPDADAAAMDEQLAPAAAPWQSHVVSVRKGDTLMDILARSGVPSVDAEDAIASLRAVYNPRELKAGQDVTLLFAPDPAQTAAAATAADDAKRPAKKSAAPKPAGNLVALRIQPDARREVGAERGREGGFSPVEVHKRVSAKTVHAAGTISTSLFDAAQSAGIPSKVLAEMIHAFSYDVDFQRDIQPGDTFDVLFESQVNEDGEIIETGRVLYAEMVLSGNHLPLYLYTTKDGDTDFFNARGESVHKALMRTPVDGARLSSGFGQRKHPILGYSRMHRGVDFAAPKGTPIMAAGSGVVVMARRYKGYGNYVEIRHDSEFRTAYAHLSRFGNGLHPGSRVKQGDVIGFVGATGLATGPHLHFEVIRRDQKVNPLSVNLPTGKKLTGKPLNEFMLAKAKVDSTVAQLAAATKVASNSK
ncbi:MAG: peptidoglycan DD-metalloendopeptidase family protein [Alphaproteobacteria bacterium]